jgi:hypothetical protein
MKSKAKEIRKREKNLVCQLDAKNLATLRDREPEIVEAINDLLDVDMSAAEIGRIVRRSNPQMWVESKFAESVARALIAEGV